MSRSPRPLTGHFRKDGRPLSLKEYVRPGGYEALRKALTELTPDDVVEEMVAAGVKGRGGAGFSAGRKWSFMARGPGAPPVKYIACNADEMEPGSFKDRVLMEGSPHLVLEGILLAGYATEATTGYIFIRGEYARAAEVLQRAIAEAHAGGYLGRNILGSSFSFEIHTHLSAGRYLCGEASGMLNALEGRRANPRARPPHMTGAGLWGRPTVVNNVETLCCAPPVIRRGAKAWLGYGRSPEGGTKIYTVAGRVKHPGWWELPLGTPMREILEEHAGGMLEGYEARAIQPGGASTAFVPAEDFDVAMDFGAMDAIGARLGTGTMFVLDHTICPVAAMVNLMKFFAQESCGWCTPCREGLPWALQLLEAIEDGEGRMGDLDLLAEIVWANRPERPFCDHAPGAIQPLESCLSQFRDDLEEHIETGRCRYRQPVLERGPERGRSGAVSALVTVTIDGADFQVQEGRNMLDVALSLGFDVPYFCWHPAMGSVGACRQCAVMLYWTDRGGREHEEIAMACMTQAEQGTRIAIQHPEAQAYRAKMIELLMVSHPHDCPVCDEGGECHLQDMTVMTGHVSRRYRFRKRTFRNQDLGPFVTHELNRCIACYRCVRFYRDYAGGSDFGVFSIRNHVYFGRQKDGTLQSEFSGNLVEVCPTGVFTDKTLAGHYTRKWDLQTAPSVCPHCGLGCSTFAAERYGEVRRVLARYNRAVNGHFLCDRGRYGYEFANATARLPTPLARQDGALTRLRAGTVPEAAQDLALDPHLGASGGGPPEQVAALKDRVSADEIAAAVGEAADALRAGRAVGIGSPRASLEANFALRTLVGPDNFYLGLSERERDLADLALRLLRGGPSPAATRTDVGNADAVVVLGVDLTNTAPILDLNLRTWLRLRPTAEEDRLHIARWNDAAIGRLKEFEPSALWLAHTHATKLETVAAGAVRGAPEELALFARALTAALDPGAPPVGDLAGQLQGDIEEWSTALRRASRPVVISGTSCGSGALLRAAADLAWRLPRGERQGAPLFLTQAEANTLGLVMMGGGRLADALAAGAVGRATAAVVLENDLFRRASAAEVEGFFSACPRVVVLDHLASETTVAADVVLPAATWAESSGTFVSAEGRAQRFFQVLVPEEGVRESWRWLRDVGGALGRHEQVGWATLQDVIEALAAELPELASIRDVAPPADFRAEGLRVNRKPPRYSGRTAMTAHLSVREPRPPDDPDSPLRFSPEGYDGPNLPAALVPRYWAPGWNSGNSLHRFQEEVNGPLRGGDLGVRLIQPGVEVAPPAAAAGATPDDDGAASAPGPESGEWLVVPLHHIFGSEELSSRAPAVATRVPPPYVGVGEDDAAQFVTDEGGYASLVWGGYRIHLPVQLVPGLPRGVAGLPVGLPGLAGVEPPFRARLVPERGRDA